MEQKGDKQGNCETPGQGLKKRSFWKHTSKIAKHRFLENKDDQLRYFDDKLIKTFTLCPDPLDTEFILNLNLFDILIRSSLFDSQFLMEQKHRT